MMADNIHLDRVRTDENFNFKTLYDSQEHEVDGLFGDSPFDQIITECDYYDPREFSEFSGVYPQIGSHSVISYAIFIRKINLHLT